MAFSRAWWEGNESHARGWREQGGAAVQPPEPQDLRPGPRGLRGRCPSGRRAGGGPWRRLSWAGGIRDPQPPPVAVLLAARFPRRPDDLAPSRRQPPRARAPAARGGSGRRGRVPAACRGQRGAREEAARAAAGGSAPPRAAQRLSPLAVPARRALPLAPQASAGPWRGRAGRGRAGTRLPRGSRGPGRPVTLPVRLGPREPREAPPRGQRASARLRLPLAGSMRGACRLRGRASGSRVMGAPTPGVGAPSPRGGRSEPRVRRRVTVGRAPGAPEVGARWPRWARGPRGLFLAPAAARVPGRVFLPQVPGARAPPPPELTYVSLFSSLQKSPDNSAAKTLTVCERARNKHHI